MKKQLACVASVGFLVLMAAGCGEDSVIIPGSGDTETPVPAETSHSECLPGTDTLAMSAVSQCGEDAFVFTVGPDTFRAAHGNAAYNCCLDKIEASVVLVESGGERLLVFTEKEILTIPCICTCCYDVETSVPGLAPGPYGIEYCWYDYGSGQERCHSDEIVIP